MRSPTTADQKLIRDAYDFAEIAHGTELRKSGEPYIIHPRAIALSLAKLGMDTDTIVAGILHDTVEDTPVTPEEIEEKFGKDVRFLVEGVTKLSKLKFRGLDRHVESLRRLLVATAADVRVIIIKLADRLHNMETIEFVAPEKRHRIAEETMEVYVPIAERLGMRSMRTELEDLAFKALDPAHYADTEHKLKERRSEMEEALEADLKDLKRALGEAKISKFRTEMRVKGIRSLDLKLKEKDQDIDKVYDLFALRIILPTVDDCYKVLGIIHALWKPVPSRIKDYIAFPKPNGYRSLHTTIITRHKTVVEIQIRTEEMHIENQFGVASHFNYKSGKKNTKETSAGWFAGMLSTLMRTKQSKQEVSSPQWLKELTAAADEHVGPQDFEEALKEDFFARRMFVFTPKGDVIDLPIGATPVDFAYAVHSDVGDTMVGARVNGKMVALDDALHNGSVVEVLTKKNGVPNKKWLEFAKTSGAKHHIRAALQKKNPK